MNMQHHSLKLTKLFKNMNTKIPYKTNNKTLYKIKPKTKQNIKKIDYTKQNVLTSTIQCQKVTM